MTHLYRREFVKAAMAAALMPVLGCAAPVLANIDYGYEGLSSLRTVAAKKGVFFGAAVSPSALNSNPDFAAAVARECNILVAENAMKWRDLWPEENRWNFEGADALVEFAQQNKMKMRGHTLMWHGGLPDWTIEAIKDGRGRALMETFIHTVMERYQGKIAAWDVVNEAIWPKDNQENGLRKSLWLEALGPDYIEDAFRLAAQADPHTKMVYNEYGIQNDNDDSRKKVAAVLKLLRRLKDRHVPIHALGIQAHLSAEGKIDHKTLTHMLKEIRKMGLGLHITELDMRDTSLPDDFKLRDKKVAEKTKEFLETVCSVIKPSQILTWGLTDRYSWLGDFNQNPSGRELRVLPLDSAYKRKPMWLAIRNVIEKMS